MKNIKSSILDVVIDVKTASEKWNLSEHTIKHLCQQNKIDCKKIGNSWAINGLQKSPKKRIS